VVSATDPHGRILDVLGRCVGAVPLEMPTSKLKRSM
jgi:hypothetical protein